MASEVTVVRPVRAAVAPRMRRALAQTPGSWLPPDRRRAGGAWTLDIAAGRLRRRVRLHVGELESDGQVDRRPLRWEPLPTGIAVADRMIPCFSGAVELRQPTPDADPTLLIHGTYEPPAGAVGWGVDALLLHHVADHSTRRLLDQIAQALTDNDNDLVGV